MRKGPKCPESLSYQKKDGGTWPRQPFFWYDTDFLDIFFFWKDAHPSFGMITAQAIRDLFAWRFP